MKPAWEKKTIGQIAEVKGGKRLPPGYLLQQKVTAHPYLRVSDMVPGGVDESNILYVPEDAARHIGRYRIWENDLFISVAGTLGLVGRVPDSLDGANLTENADRITQITCDVDFLMYYLLGTSIQREIESIRTVGAQPKLALGRIKDFEILLPPTVGEQREIARVLKDVDSMISALRMSIQKRRDIKQGTRQELLTGRTRLPGFCASWEPRSFASLLSYEQPTRYLVQSTEYSDSGVPVLTAGKSFVLGYTHECSGLFEDLPVIIFDDFTTDSKFVDFPFKAKSSAMKMLKPRDDVDLRWAFERMQLVDFQSVDHKRRWISEYSRLIVDTPPLDEQRAIAAVLRDVDEEISALERQLESARAIKEGMMQELLTGRTRLVPEVAS